MTAAAEPFLVMAKPAGAVCNLYCRYCYYLAKTQLFPAGERFRMTDEVLETYVRSFIEASPGPVVHFVWHGGEPTLLGVEFYRRAVELQPRYAPDGWTCINNLQTNGVRLDDEWCAFLAEHEFHVGISIDGTARTHDACRTDAAGGPTHEHVMRSLRMLQRHGIQPDVLCTLNSVTAQHPAEVYRFFLDQGVRWLQFLPVVQRAPGGGVSEWSVTPEAMGAFLCTVFDEWVRHDVGRIAIQAFEDCLRVAAGEPATLCIVSETCGRMLAMEHDGSVYSCDHFVDAEHLIGNVATDSLAGLVDAPRQAAFGAAKRDALPRYCLECPVLTSCNGGCPKDRFVTTADGEPGLNYLCAGYRRFYEHVAPYASRIAALNRTGAGPAAIMAELKLKEADAEAPWRSASRNDPCPCGSGRKYKQCCLGTRRAR
jgi:uncharacterized protein